MTRLIFSLKKCFNNLHSRYIRKRPTFVEKINKKGKSGQLSLYRHGRSVLQEKDNLVSEITKLFDDRKQLERSEQKRKELKNKIKKAKQLYRDIAYSSRSRWLLWLEILFGSLAFAFVLRVFVFGAYHSPSSSMEPTLLVGDRVFVNKIIYHVRDPKPGEVVMFDSLATLYDETSKFKYFWHRYVGMDIRCLGLKGNVSNFVRRVIAVPGDTIEGRIENDRPVIYRNGERIDERYVNTYPLLAMHKKVGFFDNDKIGPFFIPDVLKSYSKIVLYSYNPNKEFYSQPFYYIDCRNILRVPGSVDIQCCPPFTISENEEGRIIDKFGPYTLSVEKYWVMGDNRKNSVDSRVWNVVDRKFIRGKTSFVIWSVDSEEPFWFLECIKHPLWFLKKLIRWNRFFKRVK